MTQVHTQLNYKRKLQVDQAVVKTGSQVLSSHNRNYVYMENADLSRCENTNEYWPGSAQ